MVDTLLGVGNSEKNEANFICALGLRLASGKDGGGDQAVLSSEFVLSRVRTPAQQANCLGTPPGAGVIYRDMGAYRRYAGDERG